MGNVRIKGISGKTYKFRAYSLDTKFAAFGAVYFITNRRLCADGRISHSRIYCGQTGDISISSGVYDRNLAFRAHSANCICILPKADETARQEIESDIHQNYRLLFKG